MSRRGPRRGQLAVDRGGRRDAALMKPDRYLDVFLAETAARINFIARFATRHFEAAKFLFDLRDALGTDEDGETPRRA